MRIRTMLALGVGAAAGAAATYLLDPDHGGDRRARARSELRDRARAELADARTGLTSEARDIVTSLAAGFVEGRIEG